MRFFKFLRKSFKLIVVVERCTWNLKLMLNSFQIWNIWLYIDNSTNLSIRIIVWTYFLNFFIWRTSFILKWIKINVFMIMIDNSRNCLTKINFHLLTSSSYFNNRRFAFVNSKIFQINVCFRKHVDKLFRINFALLIMINFLTQFINIWTSRKITFLSKCVIDETMTKNLFS